MRKSLIAVALLVAAAAPLHAQEKASRDLLKFEARELGKKQLKGTTYVVPTVIVDMAVDGDVWAIKQGGGGSAKAHGKFMVSGLDKAFAQELAGKVQEDLINRLKAAGLTVKTYEDIKGDPEWASQNREEDKKDYGMPTTDQGGITYVVAAPSDDQAIKGGLRGFGWGLRKLAKNVDAVVLVPRYTFAAPQMWGEKSSGYKRVSAKINVQPGMTMIMGMTQFVNPSQNPGYTMLPGGYAPVSEEVGELAEAGSEKYGLGSTSGFMGSRGQIKGVKSSWVFAIDRDKYTEALMYGAMSYNQSLVDQILAQNNGK